MVERNNQQLYSCLIRLRNDSAFAPFLAHLDAEIIKSTKYLVSVNDDRLMVLQQGRVRALTELKELIESSQELAGR